MYVSTNFNQFSWRQVHYWPKNKTNGPLMRRTNSNYTVSNIDRSVNSTRFFSRNIQISQNRTVQRVTQINLIPALDNRYKVNEKNQSRR